MNLTPEQVEAVKHGDAVHVVDPNAGDVVVLSRDVYQRLQLLAADDTVYATGKMVDEIMAEDDANDPYLEEFQKKYGNRS